MAADCPDCQGPRTSTAHRDQCLKPLGDVTHAEGVHRAVCAVEDCPFVFESEKDGEAAHELMAHNAEEHAR